MRTTDNNGGVALDKLKKDEDETYSLEDLQRIANTKIKDIKLDEYPNLLVFPRDWNFHHDDVDSSEIFSLSNDNVLKTGNIMGFVGINDTSLTITSRFATDEKDSFLHYMLQKVFAINVLNLKTSGDRDDIMNWLLFFFPYFLNKALLQGLYKEYRHNEYNDTNVRGSVDVKRHLRINIPFMGKIAYSTREYSYNNPVMQAIRHTIEHIRTHEYGSGLLAGDTDTLMNINQITLATPDYNRNDRQKIINVNKKKPVVHPYFIEYKALQRLCLRILCNEKISTNNEKEKIHGILFDGAWLWEEYLNTILKGLGFKHPKNKTSEHGYPLFIVEENEKEKLEGRIYPDFIREKDMLIADAKYKHLEKTSGNNPDYFQLMAYMYRFNSQNGCLIYPHSGEKKVEQKHILEGIEKKCYKPGNGEIMLFGLKIPQEKQSFADFKGEMENSEKELIKEFTKEMV